LVGDKQHIILNPQVFSRKEKYTSPSKGRSKEIPSQQSRFEHGEHLRSQLTKITGQQRAYFDIQEKSGIILDEGLTIEVEGFKNIPDTFSEYKLVNSARLLNTKTIDERLFATFFVPKGKLELFGKKLDAYEKMKKRNDGVVVDYQRFIDSIHDIRVATIKSLWTDEENLFPISESDLFYWEVWVDIESDNQKDKQKQINAFRNVAQKKSIDISKDCFEFHDRAVFIALATKAQLADSFNLMNMVAELRKAKTLAEDFISLSKPDQNDYINDFIERSSFAPDNQNTPYVCILDSGVTSEHPLLRQSIRPEDCFTINDAWGTGDKVNHGTGIAGIVLFGNQLSDLLLDTKRSSVVSRLESSKLINVRETKLNEKPEVYAQHTSQAINKAEIKNPYRLRLFQMAVTTSDSRDKGKPSSWSAGMDSLAFGRDGNERKNPRLCVVSAGNYDPISTNKSEYPTINTHEGIHDPAQAWNVITVGAFTELDRLIGDEVKGDDKPVAKKGQLSPFSTTSIDWDIDWPYKPDIVMEGGNTVASEMPGQYQAASLSLLTASSDFINGMPLTGINATSAASALASGFCSCIFAKYPTLRPETVRGLLIHSASWTHELMKQMGITRRPTKKECTKLLRFCGWGVPQINQALDSIENNCTLIIEDEIVPFTADGKYCDMKFYMLPIPKKILLAHGKENVEMRVTLSYFIEPNPSSRGRSKYAYESHGLRFELSDVNESSEHFCGRMTVAMQQEFNDYHKQEHDHWLLGIKARCKGSIHSDIWNGSAADLATSNILAVWPTGGWWKTSKDMKNEKAKFSLIITIKTKADIDLLTPIQTLVDEKSSILAGKTEIKISE